MHTPFVLLSTALVLISTSTVFAASSTDFTARGIIVPSACTPELSDDGVADHGKRSAKELKPNDHTLLGNHTLQMKITCDSPTLLALRGIDNRGGGIDTLNYYGLGLVNGRKLGSYTLALDNATSDGAAISVLESRDAGLTWRENAPGDAMPVSYLASFGDRSTGNWAPTPVRNVTADLKVQTIIHATAGMDLTNEIPILGSATYEVKYL